MSSPWVVVELTPDLYAMFSYLCIDTRLGELTILVQTNRQLTSANQKIATIRIRSRRTKCSGYGSSDTL